MADGYINRDAIKLMKIMAILVMMMILIITNIIITITSK